MELSGAVATPGALKKVSLSRKAVSRMRHTAARQIMAPGWLQARRKAVMWKTYHRAQMLVCAGFEAVRPAHRGAHPTR